MRSKGGVLLGVAALVFVLSAYWIQNMHVAQVVRVYGSVWLSFWLIAVSAYFYTQLGFQEKSEPKLKVNEVGTTSDDFINNELELGPGRGVIWQDDGEMVPVVFKDDGTYLIERS